MPIDPSIPLGVKPAQFMSPAQMISLRNVVRAGQLQELQLAEAQRQQQVRAQVQAAMQAPGATDQFGPTLGTLGKVAQMDVPSYMQLLQARGTAEKGAAEAQNIEYQGAERRAGIGKENARSAVQAFDQAMKDKPGDVQNALRVAKEDEMSSIQEDIQNGRWHGAGFPEGFDRKVMSEPMTIEKINNMRAHFFTPQELAKGSEAPKTRKITQGLTEIDQEWDPASRTWKEVGRGPKSPGTVLNLQTTLGATPLTGKSPEEVKAMSWPEVISALKVPLSEQAFKDGSFQYAITNQMPKTAWGAAGNIMRRAWEEGRAKIAADYNMTPEQMASMPANWKAEATALNKLTTKRGQLDAIVTSFHNNISTWESVAKGKPPQLAGDRIAALGNEFQAIDFSDVNAINKAKIAISRQFNDPATVAYVTGAVTVAMDYARILSSQGQSAAQVSDSARNEALNLINVGYNKNAREALIGTLESDTAGQMKGLNDSISRTQRRMQNIAGGTVSPETAANAGQDKFQVNKVYKDAKGNRAKYLGNGKWEEVK